MNATAYLRGRTNVRIPEPTHGDYRQQWGRKECVRAGLLARSPRRGATDQDTVELLKWAETYWNRQTPSSFAGHSRMFANFPSTKFRLETREQATILLADLRACMVALKGDE